MSEKKEHPWDFSPSRLYRSPYPGTAVGDSERLTERDPFFSESSQRNHKGKGPIGRLRSDEDIKEDASEALFVSPVVDASEIEVVVEEGIVYLNGYVSNKLMKREAENSVERIRGVKDVFNYLKPYPGRLAQPI